MKKLKVIICPAEREPYVTNVSDTLEALQKAVGGYIEAVTVLEGVAVLCNEEGRLMGAAGEPELLSFGDPRRLPYLRRGRRGVCKPFGAGLRETPEAL